MHNRKKPERQPTEAEQQALKDKAHVYKSLVSILWEKRKQHDHSLETLAVLSKLLTSNPDFYSLWNFRREVLVTLYPGLQAFLSDGKIKNSEARDVELNITAMAIRRNPKSCKLNVGFHISV
jgi:geranylgeranyl transferase type-2 subunit alpha